MEVPLLHLVGLGIIIGQVVFIVKTLFQKFDLKNEVTRLTVVYEQSAARVLQLVEEVQNWNAGIAPAQKELEKWRLEVPARNRSIRERDERVKELESQNRILIQQRDRALGEADRAVQLEIANVNNITRDTNYTQFLALQEREKRLFIFLNTHFQEDADMGQTANTPLVDVAGVIMLRQKMELAKYKG